MVWLSRIIKESNPNARILIVTDREELDDQIEKKVFGANGVGDKIYRAKGCADLIATLNDYKHATICSLIHKFGNRNGENDSEKSYNNYIEELKKNLPTDFKAKGEFYVFVDECHRTQSGKLHSAMKTILPDAVFIGFTGTPLLAKQKKSTLTEKSTLEVFGSNSYIHTYKYNEAIADGVVLDLRYEARDIPQSISAPKRIDEWFELKTRGLTDLAKAQLKQRWGTLQNVFSSEARLGKIVCDILIDMEKSPRLKSGQGNAILIAASIYEACKYYELFLKNGFNECAIITSFSGDISSIKLEESGTGDTENIYKYKTYLKMLNGMKPETFEAEAKERFVKEPAKMKLLIVVDKLLTGFDAPHATYLYIDKSMRDHGLFQAICRVNRLDGEDKEYGCVIDYMDLFKELDNAVSDYTKEAFGEFEAQDVAGLLQKRIDAARDHFNETLESLKALIEPVEHPKETLEFIRYFCWTDENNLEQLKNNEPKRLALYRLTATLLRAYADIAPEMESLGYTSEQMAATKREVMYFKERRDEVKTTSQDYIDLKAYEADMRHLLDNYIAAGESEVLSAFEDLPLIDIIVKKGAAFVDDMPKGLRDNHTAVAEAIENNVRRKIIEKQLANPRYYEKMSELLEELIRLRKEERVEYKEYLKQFVEFTKKVVDPETGESYPDSIVRSPAMRAFYDNFCKNEEFILCLNKLILKCKKDNWRGDKQKERALMGNIRTIVSSDAEVDVIFAIVKEQREYW